MGVSLCIGSGSGKHSSLISCSTPTITRWNKAVDVSAQEDFDSIPNLMRSGPDRSAPVIDESRLARLYRNQIMREGERERLTVDTVPVVIRRAEPGHRTPLQL